MRKNAEYKKIQYANMQMLFIYVTSLISEAILMGDFHHSSSKPNVNLGQFSSPPTYI